MENLFKFSISRLNKAEYAAFMINLKTAMAQSDQEALGMSSEQFTQFNQKLNALMDQNKAETSSELTAKMKAADEERDNHFRRIRHKLSVVEYAKGVSDLSDCVDAARLLLKRYPARIVSLAYQEQTSLIAGFIMDVRKMLTSSQLKTLGIDDDIHMLDDVNTIFINAYGERATERAEQDNLQLTERLRAELLEIFNILMVSVVYHANVADPEDEERQEICQAFLRVVNQLLREAKNRLNQRLSGEADPQDPLLSPSKGEGDEPDEAGSDSPDDEVGGSEGAEPEA